MTLTVAVLLGILAGNLLPSRDLTKLTKRLLRAGIVLLGLQLPLTEVARLGPGTLLAIVLTVAVTFLGTLGMGHLLRVPRGLTMMVASGFSICGASAIAAMEGVVRREDEDVAAGVALVTIYGTITMFALPWIGTAAGMSEVDIARWAGASVHEVAQVVAAAPPAVVGVAIVVKLSRVVLLAPMVAVAGLAERKRGSQPVVPLFVLGFLAMAAVRTTGVLPSDLLTLSGTLTTILLACALFGLGYGVRIGALLRTGPRALVLGLLSTLLVLGTGLATLTLAG